METTNRLYRADRPDRYKNVLRRSGAIGTIGTILWKPGLKSLRNIIIKSKVIKLVANVNVKRIPKRHEYNSKKITVMQSNICTQSHSFNIYIRNQFYHF